MDIDKEEFDYIFADIKERYLSSINFPKLIIGTGLSIAMNIPGMSKLAKKLNKTFESVNDLDLKNLWNKYKTKIDDEGLETALSNISTSEESFVEKIRAITSEFILDEEYNQHFNILNEISGFEKLLKYLLRTVSVNNQLIDIMTPNYDRVIELICDKLKLPTTLGFSGNMYQTFNENILKQPYLYLSKNTPLVRLFKPHGSVNWIKRDNKEYQINDYEFLKNNKQYIDIVTPGSMKYKSGMINSIFRCHREIFNELITDTKKNFSIFIYGYGFNDEHFNTVFEDTQKDVVVLTRTIKKSFLDKAMENKNWTLFYKYEDKDKDEKSEKGSYMVYKCKKYNINLELWDINIFSQTFLG
jgi:hypothetical protein